jgi:PAS domain S-box-containing protein
MARITLLVVLAMTACATMATADAKPEVILQAAADPDYAPIEFVDEQGRHRGLAVDYWQRVARQIGIGWRTRLFTSWDQAVRAMQEGRADIILAAAITADRRRTGVFSDPFLSVPLVFIGRQGANLDQNIKVALVRNYAVNDWLRERHPQWTPVFFDSVASALEAVSLNNADLTVLDLANASFLIEQLQLTNLSVLGESGFRYDLAFWLHRRWAHLIPDINRALAAIPPAERDALYSKWVGLQSPHPEASTTQWLTSALAFAGWLMAGLVWLGWTRARKHHRQSEISLEELRRTRENMALELDMRCRMLDLAQLFYLVIDEEGTVLDWSIGAQQILGYRREAVAGKSIHDLIDASDQALVEDMLASIRKHPHLTPQISVQFVPHHGDHVRLRLMARACQPASADANLKIMLVHKARSVKAPGSQDSLQGYLHRRVDELPEGHHVMDALSRELRSTDNHEGVLLLFQWDNAEAIRAERGEDDWNREVLQLFQLLLEKMKLTDHLAHLGLGQFAILMPTGDKEKAWELARALQEEVDSWNMGTLRARPQLATSVGMTTYASGETAGEVLHRAKAAARTAETTSDRIVLHQD